MIYPKFLEKGAIIGVPAPSSGAYNELYIKRYQNAKIKLENMGYKVIFSKNIENLIRQEVLLKKKEQKN